MSVAGVTRHIDAIADLFMAASHADWKPTEGERSYVTSQLADLMGLQELPPSLCARLLAFDMDAFDLSATAKGLLADPPMRLRRLLELVAFVTVVDGDLVLPEDRFIRRLGAALGLEESDYRDLTLDHECSGLRPTFIKMAVVTVPTQIRKRQA